MDLNKGQVFQLLAGLTVSLSAFCYGLSVGWLSPNISKWLSTSSDIPMTEEQSSWVVSLASISSFLFTIPSGLLINTVGRKRLLLLTNPTLMVVSWSLVVFTRSVMVLYVVMVFRGIVVATGFTTIPVYLTEIADIKIRGVIGTFFSGLYFIGILVGYVIGDVFSYNQVGYINILCNAIFLIGLCFLPESPAFYILRNNMEAARRSLKWLKNSDRVEEELDMIKTFMERTGTEKSRYIDLVTTAPTRKAIFIITGIVILENLGGSVAVISYASYIFTAAGDSFLSPNKFTIVAGIVQVIAFFVAIFTVDTLGRRFLLIWSAFVCALSQIIVAAYFYLKLNAQIDTSSFSWVPAIFVSIYLFFNEVGPGATLGIVKTELFPVNLRGIASSFSTLFGSILIFVSLRIYQLIASTVGIYFNHLLFTGFCIYGMLVCVFVLFETKGLSFDKIQEQLRNLK